MTDTEFRTALIELGYRQNEFADMLRRDTETVSRWAMGRLPVPHYVNVIVELLRYKAAMNGASNPEATP